MPKSARTIRLEETLWAELADIATEQNRSVNNLIEVILGMAADPDAPEPLVNEVARR